MLKHELEIYIHIPFCKKKCDYCDFLSFPQYNSLYVPALIKEIENASLETDRGQNYNVRSIFIGGGTPSILNGEDIVAILQSVYKRFEIDSNAEITIEANPGTITKEKLEAYKDVGVNRISMGLQTTNNKELQELGRIHTYEQFIENYNLAREIGFSNINVDLMSAIPGQTVESWKEVLNNIVNLSPEHISAYSLIIEEGTTFYDRFCKDNNNLPSEESDRQMYYDTKRILAAAGYCRYEISNYSINGAECRHNIGYWQRINYLGFGLGASSLMDNIRFSNVRDMNEYLKRVENECSKLHQEIEKLSIQEQMEEYMFLGLRMISGVSITQFENEFHIDFQKVYGLCVQRLENEGLVKNVNRTISLTEKGLDISNYVMAEFLL